MSDRSQPTWWSSASRGFGFLVASRALFWLAAHVLQSMEKMVPAQGFERGLAWFFGVYARFDHGHFQRIALGGYFQLDRGNIAYDEAFFPGYPFSARALASLFGGGEPATTIAMSLITWIGVWAGASLLIHAARQGNLYGADWRIVALIVFFSPWSVFFMAPYSEGPFLAFAVAAWLLARQERWGWAAVAACGATVFRINGLFLLPMLAFMILGGRWRDLRAWARVAWLGLPTLPPVIYFTYLWSVTGDWFTWFETQKHWGRTTTAPWDSLRFSIELINAHPQFPLVFQRSAEVVVAMLYVVIIVQLVRWRRWDMVILTGLTLLSLTTSSYFISIPRSVLSCFPALIVLAVWTTKAPWWARWLSLGLCGLLLAINITTILNSQWTG